MEKLDRIKELVALLNKAGKSYYSEGQEIMSNYEYDALYDELKKLEKDGREWEADYLPAAFREARALIDKACDRKKIPREG
mgnify:CR=1 FL=1